MDEQTTMNNSSKHDQHSASTAVKITKTITFNLPRTSEPTAWTIGFFVNQGFNRKHVIMLFEKLETLGFGKYEKGRKGRGHLSKFVPTKTCPEVYLLDVEQKRRGRKGTNHGG